MLRQQERIDAVGSVVVVVHDSRERVCAGFLKGLDVPYPVLVDPELASYRTWGLANASAAGTFLSPRVALGYAKRLLVDRERLPRPGSAMLALGGDFVVNAEGQIAYSHPQQSVDDRPPVGVLVRELEHAASSGGPTAS